MYGLINNAIKQLACDVGGPEAWTAIRTLAGVDDPTFIGMEPYPDEVTFRLVAAAGTVLGRTSDEILEAFGTHWILFTANSGYGQLFAMTGRTFPEFLENLDALHARIQLTMPKLRPPRITCTDVCMTASGAGSMTVHYRSQRDGLAPMVVGLLKGLGQRLHTDVRIEAGARRAQGAEHDEFLVAFAPTV